MPACLSVCFKTRHTDISIFLPLCVSMPGMQCGCKVARQQGSKAARQYSSAEGLVHLLQQGHQPAHQCRSSPLCRSADGHHTNCNRGINRLISAGDLPPPSSGPNSTGSEADPFHRRASPGSESPSKVRRPYFPRQHTAPAPLTCLTPRLRSQDSKVAGAGNVFVPWHGSLAHALTLPGRGGGAHDVPVLAPACNRASTGARAASRA
jgi:hypothetical protein